MIEGEYVNKPDPTPETPDAPTLPNEVEEKLASCNLAVLEKISGKGEWRCTGKEDKETKGKKKDIFWYAGSKCHIKCPGTKIGVCGPKTKYPMLDDDKTPGIVRCLQSGKWDYYPKCKCMPNNCKVPKMFSKTFLKLGASYDCKHYDDESVEQTKVTLKEFEIKNLLTINI